MKRVGITQPGKGFYLFFIYFIGKSPSHTQVAEAGALVPANAETNPTVRGGSESGEAGCTGGFVKLTAASDDGARFKIECLILSPVGINQSFVFSYNQLPSCQSLEEIVVPASHPDSFIQSQQDLIHLQCLRLR